MRVVHPLYGVLHRYTKALSVALGYRDLYTRIHSERVHRLSEETAIRAGLSEKELDVLRIGAMFHDIGKIGIPDRILLKPTPLTEEETADMQRHSELGANIILATELDGADEVGRAIRSHHEAFDGSGYPDRIVGEDIPVTARIIGIADSYDAMAIARSYHAARPHRRIVEILESESGKKHDPELLRMFLEVVERSEFRSTD